MPKGNPGKLHHKWSNGLGEHGSGYIKVRVGRSHPTADKNGWAYLHRLVWWAAGHVFIPGHVLHHINGDILDNRIENLEQISRAEHNRHHNKEKKIDLKTGRFIGKKVSRREWSEYLERSE